MDASLSCFIGEERADSYGYLDARSFHVFIVAVSIVIVIIGAIV